MTPAPAAVAAPRQQPHPRRREPLRAAPVDLAPPVVDDVAPQPPVETPLQRSSAPTGPRPELLLDLPPVELGPPGTEQPRSRSLAARALLSVALLVGVLVVSAGVLAGLVGANVLAWRAGRIYGALVVATIAVVAALGQALVAVCRKPADSPFEVEVPEAEEPQLWAEVRAVADQVGTRPPDRIAVIAEVNAYVHEGGRLLGLVPGPRTLAIGAPLLDVLTASQLRAVLAHELGHLAGGDTRLGPLAYRTELALAEVVRALGGHVVSAVFVGYWKLQHRVSSGVRQAQELTADRASVAVAGRQAAADALQSIGVAAVAFDGYLGDAVVPRLQRRELPGDVTAGFRTYVDARADALAQVAVQQATLSVVVDPYATHPPTAVRIQRVEALPETSTASIDDRPARVLFADPDRWALAAMHRWTAVVTGGTVLPPPPPPPAVADPGAATSTLAPPPPPPLADAAVDEVEDEDEAAPALDVEALADERPSVPALVTADGVVLPTPPCPPFVPTADGWEARLPGRIGSKVTLAVRAEGLSLDGTEVAWDDILHTTVSLGTSNDQGVNITYELGTRGGTVKLRTSTLSSAKGEPLYDVADHVWAVLRAVVSPRLRAPVVAAVSLGQQVEVAGLLLDREGVAPARRPDALVPWKHIGDPIVDKRLVVLPAGVKTLQTPIGSRDSVLLLDLLPELRSARLRGQL